MFQDQFNPVVKVDHLGHLCSASSLMVFDIEIQDEVEATGGWNALDKMKIGVAVAWSSVTDRYYYFGDDPASRKNLIGMIEQSQVVAGFNIWSFDLPLLFGHPRDVWERDHSAIVPLLAERVFDPHRLARLAHGRPLNGPCGSGLGLQDVATATLKRSAHGGKSAHGSEAPKMFRDGKIMELCQYCQDDVWLEKNLVEFVRRHRYMITGQGVAKITSDPLWE